MRKVDRVLVSGITGIAGAHAVAALRARGIGTLGVSRGPREDAWMADLSDPSAVRALPSFDAVVHCAALTPRSGVRNADEYRRANVETTALLAAEAVRRGASTFVFVSTMGRPDQQDEDAGRHYVASKREAEERLVEEVAGRCAVWIIRAASLYGEHDRGSMARLIAAVARGRFVALGSLRHRKCLLYAGSLGDVIAGEIAARTPDHIRRESAHDRSVRSFAEVLAAVEDAVGRRALRIQLPDGLVRTAVTTTRDITDRLGARRIAELAGGAAVALRAVPCEGTNAVERLAEPPVELAEGVRREVSWLRANGRL